MLWAAFKYQLKIYIRDDFCVHDKAAKCVGLKTLDYFVILLRKYDWIIVPHGNISMNTCSRKVASQRLW